VLDERTCSRRRRARRSREQRRRHQRRDARPQTRVLHALGDAAHREAAQGRRGGPAESFFRRITLDNDVERAAKDLGMTPKAARRRCARSSPASSLRSVPALSERGVVRFHAAAAQTTHPEPGQGRTLKPPKPSKAIAAVLSEFTDLPEEAGEN
jgi:hypothetical protein